MADRGGEKGEEGRANVYCFVLDSIMCPFFFNSRCLNSFLHSPVNLSFLGFCVQVKAFGVFYISS